MKGVHSTLWTADVSRGGPYCLPVNPAFGGSMQKRGFLTERVKEGAENPDEE